MVKFSKKVTLYKLQGEFVEVYAEKYWVRRASFIVLQSLFEVGNPFTRYFTATKRSLRVAIVQLIKVG